MPDAYPYIRYSTPDQLKGDSLRRQLEASRRFIDQRPDLNLVLNDTLNLRDLGVSGLYGDNAKTGALGTFIDRIDSGGVRPGSYLLVENQDRLSRMPILEALDLFRSIVDKGIIIVTLSDQKIHTKESINDLGELITRIVDMSRSHGESVRKIDTVSKAWANKRERAITDNHKLTSVCPFWLELKGKEFAIREDRAQLVQRMFQMCIDGHGPMSIAQQLNREGVPTWTTRAGWYRDYIKKILQTPAVYGVYVPGKRLGKHKRIKLDAIPGYFPAIISEDTFLQAQDAITKRTAKGGRPGTHVNILAALLRCAQCHGPIFRLNRGNQSTPLFVCYNGRYKVSDCAYHPWPVSEVEEIILNQLTELDVRSLFSDQETKLKSIRASMAATHATIARTQADLTKLENFAIKNELSMGLVKRMRAMESEIAGYEGKLAQLHEDERQELLQRTNAAIASEQIQALRFDPLMRVKLQSHIRDLVDHIAVNLARRRIFVSYTIKPGADVRKTRIIFGNGRLRMTCSQYNTPAQPSSWNTVADLFSAGP
jgi:DNA invertase Pin-like site-specific DNA recombinase